MAEEPIVNTPFPDNWLPVHRHAAMDDAAALEAELAGDPALSRLINAPTLGGALTPLAIAAERGRLGAVAWLLRHGADTGRANDDGLQPLALAARAGQAGAIQLLLGSCSAASPSAGRMMAQADRWGRLPLLIAAAHGHAPAFACLLDAAMARAGPTAAEAQEAVLEGLYATGDGDNDTTTLLLQACRRGHAAVVRALLARGADPGHGVGGTTPLAAAQAQGGAGGKACAALLKEWERIYELAKARGIDDASQAATAVAAAATAGLQAAPTPMPTTLLSPSLAVAVHGRTGAVAAEAIKAMSDDTFSALLGMLGARTTGEAVEELMEVEEEEEEEVEVGMHDELEQEDW